jgi:hypothetical protein
MTFFIQFDEFDQEVVKIYFKCRIRFKIFGTPVMVMVMVMVMEWPTRECGNTASVQACNLRPPW